jgi:hypothetical protein
MVIENAMVTVPPSLVWSVDASRLHFCVFFSLSW